jgi:predicted peptidase
MRALAVFCLSVALGAAASPDVEAQLAKMLAAHPEADTDSNGKLTEAEAADYILKTRRRGRQNLGPGIRDKSLIASYEPAEFEGMPYRLMPPLEVEPGKRYPLVVSLHGSGGTGDDNLSSLRVWNGVMARPEWREQYPAYVLVPQHGAGAIWGPKPFNMPQVEALYVQNGLEPVSRLLDDLMKRLPVDPERVYVLGSSGGARGTWKLLEMRPELFAAAIPVCANFDVEPQALKHIPLWLFHGDVDQLVPVDQSRNAYKAMSAAGANIRYTELRGVRHNSWIQAFTYKGDDEAKGYRTQCSGDECGLSMDVWEWLFAHRKP